nr:hypothetical protein GCM10017544_00100 [Microbacterium imperiale]
MPCCAGPAPAYGGTAPGCGGTGPGCGGTGPGCAETDAIAGCADRSSSKTGAGPVGACGTGGRASVGVAVSADAVGCWLSTREASVTTGGSAGDDASAAEGFPSG